MRVLGIDPGLQGALGLIDTEACTLSVHRMPIMKRQLKSTTKTTIDAVQLGTLLRTLQPDKAWLEDVWAWGESDDGHKEGIVGAFSFGQSKGIIIGCLGGTFGIQPDYVSPARWKEDLRVPANKMLAKKRGISLFPACNAIITSEGKAEAAMIALFGCLSLGALPDQVVKPSLI